MLGDEGETHPSSAAAPAESCHRSTAERVSSRSILTRSPSRPDMTAICAKLPYEVDPPKGSSRRKAAVAEISL